MQKRDAPKRGGRVGLEIDVIPSRPLDDKGHI